MKISVLPVRMISVFCTCCLSLPFFGAASAEIVSVNRYTGVDFQYDYDLFYCYDSTKHYVCDHSIPADR